MEKITEAIQFARKCAAHQQNAFAGLDALANAVEALQKHVETSLGSTATTAAPASPAGTTAQ